MRRHVRGLVKLIREQVGEPASGAELGVYKGVTSAVLRFEFPDAKLVFVDPWCKWAPESSYGLNHRSGKHTQAEWDAIKKEAVDAIQGLPGESIIHCLSNKEASELVEDKSLDFVFIDANHTYEYVKQDIELWLPKCRTLICGHDYQGTKDRRGRGWGVSRAVHEMFGESCIITMPGRIWGVVVGQ